MMTTEKYEFVVDPIDKEAILRGLQENAFRPLPIEEEERSGWAALGEADVDHPRLTASDVFGESNANFLFRLDFWRHPIRIQKDREREAIEAFESREGRSPRRKEIADLRRSVDRALRREFTPARRVIDVGWNLNTRTIRFWSRDDRSVGAFLRLFGQSFPIGMAEKQRP